MSNDDVAQALTHIKQELLSWAESRLQAETAHRPDVNIYKRILVDTWKQVIRRINELPG